MRKKKYIEYNIEKYNNKFKIIRYIFRGLSMGNIIKLYKSALLPILIYGLELFSLNKSDYNKLDKIILKDIKISIRIRRSVNSDIIRLELGIYEIKYYITIR